jgi:thioredoxin
MATLAPAVTSRIHPLKKACRMAVEALTTDRFDATVGASDIVVVDFWAPWCEPCTAFAPVFEETARANPDLKFVKVDTDAESALARHFGVRSVPTLMIFRERVMVFQQPGALPQEALDDLLRQVRGLDMTEVMRGSRPQDGGDDDAA